MTDKALIDQIKNGDERAFESLFREHFKVLSVFAKKFLNDLDAAQDIVQEVFVKFYEQRDKLEVHTSLKALLYQSVRNRCLDQIRSTQTRSGHHENILAASFGADIDTSDFMEQAELEQMIYNSIAQLPEQCQLIFKMSRLEGKKNQDIADELGISKRTVETQISNALKRLRLDLFEYLKALIIIALEILS